MKLLRKLLVALAAFALVVLGFWLYAKNGNTSDRPISATEGYSFHNPFVDITDMVFSNNIIDAATRICDEGDGRLVARKSFCGDNAQTFDCRPLPNKRSPNYAWAPSFATGRASGGY